MNTNPDNTPDTPSPTATGDRRWRAIIIAGALLATAFLSFWNLGTYSLWGDEALTALVSESVAETGDTSALLKNGNIVAWLNGRELVGQKIRAMPPAMYYATGASFFVFGVGNWQARLPFALAGLATVALMLFWARRASLRYLLALALGMVGNVSFFLYARNCRYYALAMLATVVIAWCYWHWDGRKRWLAGLAAASSLLFASHYTMYVMVYAALFVDFLVWRRRERRMSIGDWLVVWMPQIIINTFVFLVWCPLKTGTSGNLWVNKLTDCFVLWWWHLRDINVVEFLSWPVILLAFVVSVARIKKTPFPTMALRALIGIVTMTLVLTGITTQLVSSTQVADVRYLLPALPLGVALTAWAVCRLSFGRMAVVLPLAALVFFSNITHGGMFFKWCGARSTTWCYVKELINPNPEPYRPVADWLNAHASPGSTVYVSNGLDGCYPLMFLAPKLIYAWQLDDRANPELASLPAAHFRGEELPDWVVAFGPHYLRELEMVMSRYNRQPGRYVLIKKVDVLWKDLYRPELFWRRFEPITTYNHNQDVVFIFKRDR
ncbi:hypothetical protein M2103_002235 [Ereboglobus sp. PH5-5]|uniref:glycosyltransferase family 39 protein n=1 Tax=Ereboglobus sp. PH5-5 TaxID=2940529 RepID=UPI00240766D8|nr:glycosyltransferase family 39 protein [Ereboglobus sp. PH5-5]MDF9834000.1 hypothetical protein [Ereboglobus sp. PH5-5]